MDPLFLFKIFYKNKKNKKFALIIKENSNNKDKKPTRLLVLCP
jgi:hypothetical protein